MPGIINTKKSQLSPSAVIQNRNKDNDDYAVEIALAFEKEFGNHEIPNVNKFL